MLKLVISLLVFAALVWVVLFVFGKFNLAPKSA
jgi:hypothetical protein